MKKRHQKIRNTAVVVKAVAVKGLFVYAQKVREITKNIERQIEIEQVAVEEKNTQLIELQKQTEEMDSPEYIRKIATEELGMVDEDTIVFKAKE